MISAHIQANFSCCTATLRALPAPSLSMLIHYRVRHTALLAASSLTVFLGLPMITTQTLDPNSHKSAITTHITGEQDTPALFAPGPLGEGLTVIPRATGHAKGHAVMGSRVAFPTQHWIWTSCFLPILSYCACICYPSSESSLACL